MMPFDSTSDISDKVPGVRASYNGSDVNFSQVLSSQILNGPKSGIKTYGQLEGDMAESYMKSMQSGLAGKFILIDPENMIVLNPLTQEAFQNVNRHDHFIYLGKFTNSGVNSVVPVEGFTGKYFFSDKGKMVPFDFDKRSPGYLTGHPDYGVSFDNTNYNNLLERRKQMRN